MGVLDTEGLVKKYDVSGMLQSIDDFVDQIENAWKLMKSFSVPTHYIKCNKILILGMGASGIGGESALYLSLGYCKAPIIVHKDYELPGYVDSSTLVIAVSYSGNTEETLDVFAKAGDRGAKLIAISGGGKLEALCRKYKAPLFKVEYGAAPRAAYGYLFTAVLAILHKLDFMSLGQNEIEEAIKELRQYQKKICFISPTSQNPAKQLAQKIEGRIPVMMGGGSLTSVAKRWKTQINENSKQTAYFEIFPELCHNAIVGLDYPKKLSEKIFVILLESEFDHPRNRIRQSVLHQILRKKGVSYEVINIDKSQSPLIEMLMMVMLGDYVSFYLGMINNVDPSPVDMIVFLKDKLAENK